MEDNKPNGTENQDNENQNQDNQNTDKTMFQKLSDSIEKLNNNMLSFFSASKPQENNDNKDDENKGGQSEEDKDKENADDKKDDKEKEEKAEVNEEEILAKLGITKEKLALLEKLEEQEKKKELDTYFEEKTKELTYKLPVFVYENKEQVDAFLDFAEKLYDLNKPDKVDGGSGGKNNNETRIQDIQKQIDEAFAKGDGNKVAELRALRDKLI